MPFSDGPARVRSCGDCRRARALFKNVSTGFAGAEHGRAPPLCSFQKKFLLRHRYLVSFFPVRVYEPLLTYPVSLRCSAGGVPGGDRLKRNTSFE